MSDLPSISIDLPIDDLRMFCKRHPVRRLPLFGSALRLDFTATSDVDLLVEYEPGARVTLLDMAQQEIELSELVGRKVDLRTPNELSRYFRQQVIDEAVTLYEHD
ncbi:MAG: nucleotidyltransferase domain-containing protein [Anaerolineae bacterium]|nr:nucleotidyltransferase domain-containing protein [Anaerolineae bacterium]